ncbi:integral membrane protein DUF92-domain-containing protein [Cladochytrium replicatum]|nr:integral membrane protein DUF92-domain-containing protein [Cladochytrium replicatum]
MNVIFAALLCSLLAIHGLSRRSLSPSGATAATVVGLATFTHNASFTTFTLLAFYLSSSFLTKLAPKRKSSIDADYKKGGQRNATQVFSNAATAVIILIAHRLLKLDPNVNCLTGTDVDDRLHAALFAAYIAHYACCNGDTWASELGVLDPSPPILITTFKTVPAGTNGGISRVGTTASLLGGLFIGLVALLTLPSPSHCQRIPFYIPILFGASAGLLGSLIDSVLGSTLQLSMYNPKTGKISNENVESVKQKDGDEGKWVLVSGRNVLDNHQVNFVSSLITAVIGGAVAWVYSSSVV